MRTNITFLSEKFKSLKIITKNLYLELCSLIKVHVISTVTDTV